jgi:hypothetical protein
MTLKQKIAWMEKWCKKHGAELQLEGECGFGRPCVGIIASEVYPDYEWRDSNYKRIDNNRDVWIPGNAYHKHPCVAVLGRGDDSIGQLFDWLKWFDDNGFVITTKPNPETPRPGLEEIWEILGKNVLVRMERRAR